MRTQLNNPLIVAVLCLFGGLLVTMSSCDDDEGNMGSVGTAKTDMYDYWNLLGVLFNGEDSLYSTPAIGEALDATAPTVYSIGVEDAAEARDFFNQCCLRPEAQVISSDGSILYDLGEYGNISYHPVNDGETIAVLDVSLPEVSSVSQIRFIPCDLWPGNATSEFHVGDIVKDTKHKWYWVCVQELNGGRPAIFITFDNYESSTISGTKIKQTTSASATAMRAWYSLVNSGVDIYLPDNPVLKPLLPNLYECAGYMNGRLENTDLYFAVGSSFEGSDEKHAQGVSSIMTFDTQNPRKIPIGEPLEFMCTQEQTFERKDTLVWCNPYLHSGTITYNLFDYKLQDIHIWTHSYSISYTRSDAITKMFRSDNALNRRLYVKSTEYGYTEALRSLFETSDLGYNRPLIGTSYDANRPTEYTLYVQDAAEAASVINKICADSMRLEWTRTGADYDLGEYGSLVYRLDSTKYYDATNNAYHKVIGTLNVDLFDVYSLTQIQFVARDPISNGRVVSDIENGYPWICVQELTPQQPAIFMTFVDEVESGAESYPCANKAAFNAWYQVVSNDAQGIFSGASAQQLRERAPYIYDAAGVISGKFDSEKLNTLRDDSIANMYLFYYVGDAPQHLSASNGLYFSDVFYDNLYTIVSPKNEYFRYVCFHESLMKQNIREKLWALYPDMMHGKTFWNYRVHRGAVYSMSYEGLPVDQYSPYSGERLLINTSARSVTIDNVHDMYNMFKEKSVID
jgi:hypothetical protein